MSNVSRGAETERKARFMLEQLGFRIMFKSVRMKWQHVDFDNAFDICAIKKPDGGNYPLWWFVSVKTNCSSKKKEIAKLKEWKTKNALDNMKVVLMNLKSGKKEFEIIQV